MDQDKLNLIDEKNDLHIAPFREDGTTYGTPTWIWSVVVDGELYVRAYYGKKSRWYTAAMREGAGKIEAAGMTIKVKFESVTGDINSKIDEAYKAKYAGSPYLNHMIGNTSKEATVRIIETT